MSEFLEELAESSLLSADPVKHLYVLPDESPVFKGVEAEGTQIVCHNILGNQVVLSFIKASAHVKTVAAIATKHRREQF